MDNNKNLKWCSSCLSMSTRPRITFDESGKCNACQWKETKKSINWEARSNQLKIILESQKKDGLIITKGMLLIH